MICAVHSCNSQERSRIYHKFPNDPKRHKEWMKSLGCKHSDLNTLSVVCSEHFYSKDYYPGGNRLRPHAVPLIYSRKTNQTLTRTGNNKELNGHRPNTSRENIINEIASHKEESLIKPVRLLPGKLLRDQLQSSTNEFRNLSSKPCQKSSPKKLSKSQSNEKSSLCASSLGKETLEITPRRKRGRPVKKAQSLSGFKRSPVLYDKLKGENSTMSPNMYWKPLEKSVALNDVNKECFKMRTRNSIKIDSHLVNVTVAPEHNICTHSKSIKKARAKSCKINTTLIDNNLSNCKTLESESQNYPINVSSKSNIEIPGNKMSLKRRVEEVCFDSHGDKDMSKRKKLLANTETQIKPAGGKSMSINGKSNGGELNFKNLSKDTSVETHNKENIINIEQTILEMQNKILKLEQKSKQDEEQINIFKVALIKQRNHDIKMLMDEKENELLLRMDLLYLDYEPQRVCSLCLLLVDKKEALASLVKNQALLSFVKNTLHTEIELDDGTPTGLCDDCLQQIKKIHWIRRRCQTANLLSKKFITIKKSLSESSNLEPVAASSASNDMFQLEHIIDEVVFEEEQQINSFKIEDAFSLKISSEEPLDSAFIKVEPLIGQEARITPSVVMESATCHLKFKAGVKKVQKCRNCQTLFTNCWSLKKHYKYCNKKFRCFECEKCFFNSTLFRMHKLRRQSCISAEVFRYCVHCSMPFRWKWQLVFHLLILKHRQQNNWQNRLMKFCFG